MLNIPIIKLELKGMQYCVQHALMEHHGEIEKAIEEELRRVIADFDFVGEVRKVAIEVIRDSIRSNFQYGEGHDAINMVVAQVVGKAATDFIEKMRCDDDAKTRTN